MCLGKIIFEILQWQWTQFEKSYVASCHAGGMQTKILLLTIYECEKENELLSI